MTPKQLSVIDRITEYLSGGGLFNPELANHDAVRDLLIDAREAHAAALEELARLRARLEIDFATDGNGKRVPFPTGGPDGIACRDETIRILESALAEAERKCERLRFHAEAMAKDLELSYEVGESSLAAYRAEFKE